MIETIFSIDGEEPTTPETPSEGGDMGGGDMGGGDQGGDQPMTPGNRLDGEEGGEASTPEARLDGEEGGNAEGEAAA